MIESDLEPEGEDTRQWLYRLRLGLPGFLSIGVARYLGDLREFGDFELTTYSWHSAS